MQGKRILQPPAKVVKANTTTNSELEGLRKDWRSFTLLPEALTTDRSFIEKAVQLDGRIYSLLSKRWRADKKLFLAALINPAWFCHEDDPIHHAPKAFFDDENMVGQMIRRDLCAFTLASRRIRTSPKIICGLFKSNRDLFEVLDAKLRGHREVLTAALQVNCDAFCYASDALKADRAFVTSCLTTKGIKCNLVRHASEEIRDDPNVILKAVNKFGPYAVTSATPRLLTDRNLVKKAFLAGIGQHRNYFPDWVKKDRELCLIAIKNSYHAFSDADYELQNDLEFCLEAYQANPDCLSYIPSRIRKRSAFRKIAPIEQEGPTPAEIRQAFAKALKICGRNHQLSGRGHDPRVTLSKSTAAAIKGLDLPRVSSSGFGAKWYYPQSLVDEAAKLLGVGPTCLRGL